MLTRKQLHVSRQRDKTNPNAQKVVEVIIKNARPELLQYYPVATLQGENGIGRKQTGQSEAVP